MALIRCSKLGKAYGAQDVFADIIAEVPRGAKIALVGPNGAGKTTLLRLLAGLEDPSAGTVSRARGLRIGFLPQESERTLAGDDLLWDEMLSAFSHLIAQQARLADLEAALAGSDDPALLADYGSQQEAFELAGGYTYETRIRQVLSGLGFDANDFQRPLSQLSGGQKTRALLARLLLENPDLLILDEPTNHLDLQALEWLEKWLRGWEGALLLVSHDRYFMDRVVSVVWELTFGRLETYRGNYTHYTQQREARHARLRDEFKAQQEYIARTEDYIQRNIAGQNTRQAQGRRKRLERFKRDDAIQAPQEARTVYLDMKTDVRSGDQVLITHDLQVGYHDDGVPLFAVPDITLLRGECAALIGPNGAGKTTFLKTVLGDLAPLSGEGRLGASVQVGYFAQAHKTLDPARTVIDEILSVRYMPESEARTLLGRYLFSRDDVYKPVVSLSGGERGRVALAKLALSGANFLLLDEPTNHLDIPSQEALEAALDDFEGTILLVSHDRYLIRDLATQIWALDSGQMTVFEGPYDDYLASLEPATSQQPRAAADQPDAPVADRPRSGLTPYQRARRLEELETAIGDLEAQLQALNAALAAASEAGDVARVAALGEDYGQAEAQLETHMAEWEALHAEG